MIALAFVLFLLLPYSAGRDSKKVADNLVRQLLVYNEQEAPVDVYWVNAQNGDSAKLSPEPLAPGSSFPVNTFVGHHFELKESGGKDGKCSTAPEKTCRAAQFVVSPNRQQAVHVMPDFSIDHIDHQILAQRQAGGQVARCRSFADKALASGQNETQVMDSLMNCVEGRMAETLEKVHEDISFQAAVRTDIAAMLENFTCLDDTLPSSPDVDTYNWEGRTVHVKHSRPASRIHVIENFINEEECEAMSKSAEKSLHRATVADGKGGSRLSENRKAMQAGITVPWKEEADGHPIAVLSRRVYDYTNHVLGLNISEDGQEDLMSIQYFGRGKTDAEPDRYTPHCDGECTGQPHKWGTRMATLVMYCDVADEGGHTNFRNSGVHIKPSYGAGIFFSYINPETLIMDNGFTEHSGCPVFGGTKRIVTQWVRLGVDKENPWNSFNTLGMKRSMVSDD